MTTPTPQPLSLERWIIDRRARQPDLKDKLGVGRTHLWRIQVAACMPSHDLAARIASLMAEDGITTTAGALLDHQAARIAERVGYEGREIWPGAPRARKLREAKP